jgi:hypothetical protein
MDRPNCLIEKILENILPGARQRPVIIQSLFPLLNHEEPSANFVAPVAIFGERCRSEAVIVWQMKASGFILEPKNELWKLNRQFWPHNLFSKAYPSGF